MATKPKPKRKDEEELGPEPDLTNPDNQNDLMRRAQELATSAPIISSEAPTRMTLEGGAAPLNEPSGFLDDGRNAPTLARETNPNELLPGGMDAVAPLAGQTAQPTTSDFSPTSMGLVQSPSAVQQGREYVANQYGGAWVTPEQSENLQKSQDLRELQARSILNAQEWGRQNNAKLETERQDRYKAFVQGIDDEKRIDKLAENDRKDSLRAERIARRNLVNMERAVRNGGVVDSKALAAAKIELARAREGVGTAASRDDQLEAARRRVREKIAREEAEQQAKAVKPVSAESTPNSAAAALSSTDARFAGLQPTSAVNTNRRRSRVNPYAAYA
jgi:hypothetical protein